MCSISNQTPVQLQLTFKPANSSYTDVESFLQQPHVKIAPPLTKSKRYSHKLLRAMDPTNTTINSSSCSNKDNQRVVFARASVSTTNTKKSSKLRSKHTIDISSSLDTSFITSNEDIKCTEKESCCRNGLTSPHRSLRHKDHKSCHYRQPTDTDELLRKVSIQLMRAQNGDVSRRCDKSKIVDISKNWVDNQKSVTLSSAESPKLSLRNDISPTSDDCGQFSGCSTPDHQVSGQSNTIDEDQLRLACEHIIEQQQKAWLAFKRAKRNGRRSLTRQALDIERHPLKESPISNTSDNVISIHCKNEVASLKASNTCEEGHISSEQFDSGHGSSEEHEIVSKTEWFPSAGNTNSCISISRPHYRYHMRRQKGHCPGSKPQTSLDSVPSPLEAATATMKTNLGEQRRSPRDNSSEFKQSSFIDVYSQATKSKNELLLEANSFCSPSQFPSYVSSHVCSGLTSCSSSSFSSTVDIPQVMTNCSPATLESACMVRFSTEETLSNHNSSNENNKTPKQTVRLRAKMNATSLSSSSLSSLTPSASHTSKNSSKKENNKSNVKLYTTLARSCISCGFIANACSKIVQIRKTISGKTSNILSSTKFSGD